MGFELTTRLDHGGSWVQISSETFEYFPSTLKRKSSVFNFLRFQERFQKAPFSVDNFSGLVWTKGLTGEIKLSFQIPPA